MLGDAPVEDIMLTVEQAEMLARIIRGYNVKAVSHARIVTHGDGIDRESSTMLKPAQNDRGNFGIVDTWLNDETPVPDGPLPTSDEIREIAKKGISFAASITGTIDDVLQDTQRMFVTWLSDEQCPGSLKGFPCIWYYVPEPEDNGETQS